MNERVITRYLCCPACRGGELQVEPLRREGAELLDAIVSCRDCETWYRLEDGLLELLVPTLRLAHVDDAFCKRVSQLRASPYRTATRPAPRPEDEHKLGQKVFYDEDAGFYETHMMRLPFWRSFDRNYIATIEQLSPTGGTMVEIGGGSGRISIPMRETFRTILSFDISEAMVRRAMRRRDELTPRPTNVHYFVADAENVPIRASIADVAIFSGILHHVGAPDQVITEAARILRPGGRFIGMENNRTVFRPIFDWLMSMNRLWNEKAHPEHFIISGKDLHAWFAGAKVSGRVWTSVFIPPHAFTPLSTDAAGRLLKASDALARRMPWLRDQGGLVLFAGEKPQVPDRPHPTPRPTGIADRAQPVGVPFDVPVPRPEADIR